MSTSRPPTASVLPAVSKSVPRSRRAAAGASGEHGDDGRVGLADDGRRRRLDDPGLLAGDVGQRRPGELVVVHADVGDHGDLGVDDVGGVPPPEQADLDDGDVDGGVGEPAERGGRARLEVARPDAGQSLEVGDGGDLLGQVLVVDGHGVAGPALVDPLEVRAGVRADLQALGHQQAGDHLRRRALAVGAR